VEETRGGARCEGFPGTEGTGLVRRRHYVTPAWVQMG
jgi:hypothetical protein